LNTKTNTFRMNEFKITNSFSQQALVWPISPFMYAVKWDDQEDTKTLPKSTVDSVIKDGTWKIITEEAEKELLDTFKFVHYKHKHLTYTAKKQRGGIYTVTWKHMGNLSPIEYTTDIVKGTLENGVWIMLEDANEEPLTPDVMNYCYEILSKVAPDPDEEYYDKKYAAATKLSTLEAIKEFVGYSNHYVVLEKDYYAVYRDGEDDAYKCYSDESLTSVMNALSVLDIHEEKPMYFSPNLEGVS
jgi:hypothetical protein